MGISFVPLLQNMAAVPNNLLITLTEHVLELNEAQRNAITNNGWVRLEDFRDFGYELRVGLVPWRNVQSPVVE